MKKIIFSSFIIILSALLLIYPVQGEKDIEIRVMEVSGKAEVLEKNIITDIFQSPFWKDLKKGEELDSGDKIKTSANSTIEIYFSNDTFLKISENSRVIIGENKIKESGQSTSINLQKGKVWSRIKGAWNRLTKFEVITPSAVAGVKGTIFSVETDGEETILKVKEGEVEFSARERKEEKVTVKAGQSSQVVNNKVTEPKNEDSPGKSNWDDEKIEEWLEKTEGNPGKAYNIEMDDEEHPSDKKEDNSKNDANDEEEHPSEKKDENNAQENNEKNESENAEFGKEKAEENKPENKN